MSMATQCPGCKTTFRVTSQQLQAQHGKVRCGRCATVFDGFGSLAAFPEESQLEAAPPAAAAVTQSQIEPWGTPARSRTAVDEAVPETRPQAEFGPRPRATDDKAAAEMQQQIEAGPAPMPAWETAVPEPQPAAPFAARPMVRRGDWGWACGILVLLALLGTQAAYYHRSDIAAGWPETRPYLAWLCEQLQCTVALPQAPRLISIEGSDMMATDAANPGLIALTATLRNQATIELGYPALDVVLTNTRDHTIARRIFLPAEYLGPGRDPRAGIPPKAEITIRLDIDSGGLGAAGFRLELLRAPVR